VSGAKRITGTNAPGGEWHSAPNAKRGRPYRKVTAKPSTWEALDTHVPDGARSAWIEEAMLEKLRREGVKV
jgi:hypothetical protein